MVGFLPPFLSEILLYIWTVPVHQALYSLAADVRYRASSFSAVDLHNLGERLYQSGMPDEVLLVWLALFEERVAVFYLGSQVFCHRLQCAVFEMLDEVCSFHIVKYKDNRQKSARILASEYEYASLAFSDQPVEMPAWRHQVIVLILSYRTAFHLDECLGKDYARLLRESAGDFSGQLCRLF